MNSPTTDTSAQSQQPGAVAHAQRDIINPATGEADWPYTVPSTHTGTPNA